MKLAFSTLACPNFTWDEIVSTAADFDFDGVEIRGLGEELSAYHAGPFTETHRTQTLQTLKTMRLSIPCFSSDCCLKDSQRQQENFLEIKSYIDLAAAMNTPYVRILADQQAAANGEVSDQEIVRQLRALAPYAQEHQVTLLVESNGVYADTARLCRLLDQVARDSVAALWDVHHPYRFMGESPEESIQNLGAYVKYVHIKDSLLEEGKPSYKMMGEGDLPIQEILSALRSVNYEGFLTLEWVKRWSANLEDAGIVIPQFSHFMNQYQGSRPKHSLLQNRTGTGHYIWEKETLIDLTFPALLDRICEEFPDQPAFRYTELDYTRSYSEFRVDVNVFARALIAMGVKRGDKVAIWSTNVPQWFITFWAATKIGAILVTVNSAYKVHEAEYLLRQSDTHTLVMIDGFKDSNYVEILHSLCPELADHQAGTPLFAKRLPFLRNVVTVDSRQPGCYTWEEACALAEQVSMERVYQRQISISRHDVCNMQYTSGTTGFPKGVMLTHHNVINNGKNIGDRMDLSTADRFLIQVPMFHCFGMVLSMTAAMTHGATMVPIPAYSPTKAMKAINLEKITAMNGVPTMFIAILEHPDFENCDFSHMRTGIMAGSPCPVKVMQDVIRLMNMKEITIVFGQTESSPGCTMSNSDDDIEVKVNTVGKNLPGIECKVVDPETGEELPDNTDGEFVARGYNIMKGYYKMPAATAAAIDAEGWLHTGDLARKRSDGNFKITGRIKDMIIRGGENIYPKEIEDFIYTHEKVRDVQVIGVPDQQYGEEIMACIILKENVTATPEEMRDFVRDHMAKQKTPKYIRFVASFPMNAAGKILKYRMVEDAVSFLGLETIHSIETA